MRRKAFATTLIAAALLSTGAFAQGMPTAPEAATGRSVRNAGTARTMMATAANPLAAAAGREMLRRGGTAVDAAVAMQLVLNVVEPQSSGIGGGAFMLAWSAGEKRLRSYDGREAAPEAARPDRFLKPDGTPVPFREAVVGGRSVGVPGTLRLLEAAHAAGGRLPWADLFAPAVRLAEEGFAVSPRLNGLLRRETALKADPRAAAVFFEPDGTPKSVGATLRNPALADTFRILAREGAKAFYEGPIADDVVATVAGHPAAPGDLSREDLRRYAAVERDAVCGPYRVWRVCGMGPPSSGGIAVLQILSFLEPHDLAAFGPSPAAGHLLAEAGRLAFADRNLFVADPAFVSVPVDGLLDPDYLLARGRLIDPARAMGRAQPGDPPRRRGLLFAPSEEIETGTSHLAAVDAEGNAVSMTTSIEDAFGARLMTAGGFLLNNQMTDFAFVPEAEGRPVANRVEPGKRPRSSMSPTVVFDAEGKPVLLVGAAGGALIIGYVAKTVVAVLDWKLDPQQAVDFGNIANLNGSTLVEAGAETGGWKAALEALGHVVTAGDMTSGTQAILIGPQGLSGGADGRREGAAVGD